ncbi:glycine cleavage system protein R [Rugosimonospora africana]|uniref:glycine cleavage system protein R n=1 Tax=Rugosimonospora africana TaxID=556532 RepID=UPI00194203DF|nr:ACT domain-containing protein [Rugosimonospora africana]
MNELAITVVGRDRPGIIADVSAALSRLGLNLTDSTMTLLRGHFAMTLICVGEVDESDVLGMLEPLTADGGLLATAHRVPPEPSGANTGAPYTLLVHGADRLGIVAAVTGVMAEIGGNVTDLTTRLSGTLYLLSAEIDLPSSADFDELLTKLDEVADRLGVEVSLRSGDADVL